MADLGAKTVKWFVRGDSRFDSHNRSNLLGITGNDVVGALRWTVTFEE